MKLQIYNNCPLVIMLPGKIGTPCLFVKISGSVFFFIHDFQADDKSQLPVNIFEGRPRNGAGGRRSKWVFVSCVQCYATFMLPVTPSHMTTQLNSCAFKMFWVFFCFGHVHRVDRERCQNGVAPNKHQGCGIWKATITETNAFWNYPSSLCYFWKRSRYCQRSFDCVSNFLTPRELSVPFDGPNNFFLSHCLSPGNKTNPKLSCYYYQVTIAAHCCLRYCDR